MEVETVECFEEEITPKLEEVALNEDDAIEGNGLDVDPIIIWEFYQEQN